MRTRSWRAATIFWLLLGPWGAVASAAELSGSVTLEPRWFFEDPLFPEQPDAGLSWSAVLAPELRFAWNEEADRFTIAPFFRFDADDEHRNHGDVREAIWRHAAGPWTWQVGVGRVFWGVTESRHLVDIVNQTDLVEDIDEEDKLGQPMISVERWWRNAGTFALFLLPGFRERTFPAADARLRGPLPVDTDRAQYESGAKGDRLDLAVRWARAFGNWDLGVSAFQGNSREPTLLPGLDPEGLPVLVPRYEVISQAGLDVQHTTGAWLWKLEALAREGYGERFAALVAGFEFTLFDLGRSGMDLGLLLEYLYDGRSATAPPTLLEDDLFVGLRLAINDVDDTSILAGAIVDRGEVLAIVETQRRIGARWRIELEARLLIGIDSADPRSSGYANDSFATLRLARYL